MSSSFVDTTATSSVADSSSALQCTTQCSNVDCTKDTLLVRMDTEKQSLEETATHHHSCDPLDSTNCPCHESKENQTCNQNISSGTTIASTSPTTGVLHTRITPSSGGSTSVCDINNSNLVNNNGVAASNGSNSNNSDINAFSSLSQQQHQSPSSTHHLPFTNANHYHSSSTHQHHSQNDQTSQSQLLFRSQQNSSSSLFNALSSPPFFLNESFTKTSPMTSMPHQLSSSLPNTSPLMSPVSTTAARMSTTSTTTSGVAVQAEENDLINCASSLSTSSPATIAIASSSAAGGGGGKSSRGTSQSSVSKKFHSSSSTHRKGGEIACESAVPDGEGEDDDEEEEDTSSSSEPAVPLDAYRNKWYRYPVVIPNEHRIVVNKLRADGHIRTEKVYQTMLQVNFGNFGSWSYSYSDASLIANELENCANLMTERSKVLVINSWYYLYIPLCLSLMVGPKGYVVGHGDEGVEFVRKDHAWVLDKKQLILVDFPWEVFKTEGFPLKAPYDLILVHDQYFTAEIKVQLKSNGIAFDQVNNKLVFSHHA